MPSERRLHRKEEIFRLHKRKQISKTLKNGLRHALTNAADKILLKTIIFYTLSMLFYTFDLM